MNRERLVEALENPAKNGQILETIFGKTAAAKLMLDITHSEEEIRGRVSAGTSGYAEFVMDGHSPAIAFYYKAGTTEARDGIIYIKDIGNVLVRVRTRYSATEQAMKREDAMQCIENHIGQEL